MPDKKNPKKGISFVHLGGQKIGHHIPVKPEKEISFEHIGGRKVGHFRLEEPDALEEKDHKANTE